VEPLGRKQRRLVFHPCANGCISRANGMISNGRVSATHRMWLLGRHWFVCARCARLMEAAYVSALEPADDAEMAA
jgi:hypothetical protein